MNRILAPILVTFLVALAVACGGGGGGDSGGGSGPISEKEAQDTARDFMLTIFGLLSGSKQPQAMVNLYAPECREGVDVSELGATFALIRAFLPSLSEIKIEDVDFGKLKLELEPDGDGVRVTPVDPSALRIKVAGKFVNADDYFSGLGFTQGESPTSDIEAILMVRRKGKVFLGDCEDLSGLSGTTDPTTPTTSQRTPTTLRTGPGSSRTNPVALGQPAQVEKLWDITVLSVNNNAAALVKAVSSFNSTPTPSERLVLITLRAKSISTSQKAESIDDFNFRLTGSRNELYSSYNERNSCGIAPNEISANLFPGGQTEGNVCFKVPADETGFLLVWEEFFTDDLTFFRLD